MCLIIWTVLRTPEVSGNFGNFGNLLYRTAHTIFLHVLQQKQLAFGILIQVF